jgi:predicted AAA+ superfamily ATPase
MMTGARQVGKTYVIQEFCKENFDQYLFLNLERDEDIRAIFEKSLKPDEILKQIGYLTGEPVNAEETVIFIDEIQYSERAITSLKYFAESEVEYRVIVAGSLLGVALNRFKSSFPVGKVDRMILYPMDFEEFLWALGQEALSEEIIEHFESNTQIAPVIHKKLIVYYKDYLFIGGMPESIMDYIGKSGDLNYYSRKIKSDILSDYLADMSKYTTNSESTKIKEVFQSISDQLGNDANRFRYNLINPKANKRNYSSAIEWLLNCNLVMRSTLSEGIRLPLNRYHKMNMFKIFMGDVGLLSELSNMAPMDLVSKDARIFTGDLTENFVAQTLISNGIDLYYWRSGNTAEIDFLIVEDGKVVPIEVKAATNTKSKSLATFVDKYSPKYSIRISQKNFGFMNNIKLVPLYATHLIGRK